MSDFKTEMEENNMVYVTWADADDKEVNVVSFSTMEEAEEFVKENNLSDIADINAMDWQIERLNNDFNSRLEENIMTEKMYEELKDAIIGNGTDAIDDFLGYELNQYDERTIKEAMDDVLDQMPEDVVLEFYNEYC